MSEPTDKPHQAPGERSMRQRAAQRLLGTASELVALARSGVQSMADAGEPRPAAAADVLLMDAQHSTYVQLHRRFTERASLGQGGLRSALDALDALWENIRILRGGAPTILLTLSNADETVQDRRARFYFESTMLLEDAIRAVFATDLGQLALPPERMAVLVRIAIEGLVVELAQAKNAADVAAVDQAYADLRTLFERFILGEGAPTLAPLAMPLEPIPLPW